MWDRQGKKGKKDCRKKSLFSLANFAIKLN